MEELWIKIKYFCEHDKTVTKTFYDLAAQCIQHELDHMNGKLCTDYTHSKEGNESRWLWWELISL